jgi:tetratricopeptide (TPR) repeat protein
MRVGVVVILMSLVAQAEEPTISEAERTARAKAWFEKGRASFRLEDFESAVHEFEEGYRYRQQPLFLYNIAQSARRAGHLEKSLDAYKRYLAARPDAPERRDVEHLIEELSAKLAARPPPPPTPPPPVESKPPEPLPPVEKKPEPVPAPVVKVEPERALKVDPNTVLDAPDLRPARRKKIAGLTVAAVGALALIGGGIASGLAAGAASDVRNEAAGGAMFDPAVESRGKAADTASFALYGIGAAALVVGAVVAAIGWREAKR